MNEIINATEVLDALTDGFEVLMINKNKTNRFGVLCIPLTDETFSSIVKFIDQEDENRIYIKTDKYIKVDEEDKKDEE